jgi:hypothetical protein
LFEVVLRNGGARFRPANGRKLVPAVIDVVSLPGSVSIVVIGDDAAVLVASIAQDSVVHLRGALDHRPVVPAAVGERRLHDDFGVGNATSIAAATAVAEVLAPLWITDAAAAAIIAAATARAGAKIGAPVGIADAGAAALAVLLDSSLEASRLKAKGGCDKSNYKFHL